MLALPERVSTLLPSLLVLGLVVGGCGVVADERVEPGTVVPGQFADEVRGADAEVLLPTGALRFTVGEPISTLRSGSADDLEERSAPEGGSFVPVVWRFDPDAAPQAAARFVGDSPPPATLSLRIDGSDYELGSPYPTAGEDGLTPRTPYYVAVDGDAEDIEIRVEYDGVTQSVDALTGERAPGRADGLYDDAGGLEPPRCPAGGWQASEPIDFRVECEIAALAETPYVGRLGGWAEPGRTWLVADVGVALPEAALAVEDRRVPYGVEAITDRTTLGGVAPVEPMATDPGRGYVASGPLVFDVGPAATRTLNLAVDFTLVPEDAAGVAPDQLEVTLARSVRLPS